MCHIKFKSLRALLHVGKYYILVALCQITNSVIVQRLDLDYRSAITNFGIVTQIWGHVSTLGIWFDY